MTATDSLRCLCGGVNVELRGEPVSRALCPDCGETVFGTSRLNMRVVPNSFVARATGGALPDELHATMLFSTGIGLSTCPTNSPNTWTAGMVRLTAPHQPAKPDE